MVVYCTEPISPASKFLKLARSEVIVNPHFTVIIIVVIIIIIIIFICYTCYTTQTAMIHM